MQSDSIAKLVTALVKVQKELRGYKEDSKNPFFNSSYGDLSSVWAAVRDPLTKNGLAIIQTNEGCDDRGRQKLRTILAHESGEWIDSMIAIRPTKEDPQQSGSAITYARRYSLAAIVGVAPEDDDAEGAMDRTAEAKERIRKAAQKAAQKKADAMSAPQRGTEQMSAPQQPSDVINPNMPDKTDIGEPDKEYITFEVSEFKRETGKAVCVAMPGFGDVWIAKSQILGNFRPPLTDLTITKWVAGEKGLIPTEEEPPPDDDDVPF
jgi:hypothetical protein